MCSEVLNQGQKCTHYLARGRLSVLSEAITEMAAQTLLLNQDRCGTLTPAHLALKNTLCGPETVSELDRVVCAP